MAQEDFRGVPLEVGDLVTSTDGGYKSIVVFEVIGFTPRKVRVIRTDGQGQLASAAGGSSRRAGTPTLKDSCDIARLEPITV